MTIPNETEQVEIAGNGTLGPYAVPFWFLQQADLRIFLRHNTTFAITEQILDTNYTVSNENTPPVGTPGSPEGFITFIGTAPTADETVVIWRQPPNTQLLTLPAQGGVPLPNYESAYDHLTVLLHSYLRMINRCVRLQDGARAQNLEIPSGSVSLWLAVDENGDLVLRTISSWVFLGDPPPDNNQGNDGDIGLDSTGRIWFKTSGVWVDSGTVIRGVPGPNLGIPWDWNTSTVDEDPGTGRIGHNSAVPPTMLFVSKQDKYGTDRSVDIVAWGESTTALHKGDMEIVQLGVGANRQAYKVTAAPIDATPANYFRVPVEQKSASTTPANGEEIGLLFSRAGDRGTDGAMSGPGAGTIVGETAVYADASGTSVGRPGTSHTIGAIGTTAQRPGTPTPGMRRFNSEGPVEEVYLDGTSLWQSLVDNAYLTQQLATVDPRGRHTVGFPLHTLTPRSTNGATAFTEETATPNFNMFTGYTFAAGVDQFVQTHFPLPYSEEGSDLYIRLMWRAETATAGAVRWACRACLWRTNVGSAGVVFGTLAVTVQAPGASAKDLIISADIGPITPSNKPATYVKEQALNIEIYRNGLAGSDTMTGDATLLNAWLYLKTDQPTDDRP